MVARYERIDVTPASRNVRRVWHGFRSLMIMPFILLPLVGEAYKHDGPHWLLGEIPHRGLAAILIALNVVVALFFAARLRRLPVLSFALPILVLIAIDIWLIHAVYDGTEPRFGMFSPDAGQSMAIFMSPFFLVALLGAYGAVRLQFDRRYPRLRGFGAAAGMLADQWFGSRHGLSVKGLVLIACAAIFLVASLWLVLPILLGIPSLSLRSFPSLLPYSGYLLSFTFAIGPAALIAAVIVTRAGAMRPFAAALYSILILSAAWEILSHVAWRLKWPFPSLRGGISSLVMRFGNEFASYTDVVVLGLVLFLCAAVTGRAARQVMAVSASAALAHDKRQPILLLRSFADDTRTIEPYGWVRRILRQTRRLEEIAAQVLTEFGPFIAIGKPGETLPELGASRDYFDAETWQAAIIEWMETSRYVVMIGGVTEAIGWELRTLIERGLVHKLVVVIPPGRKDDAGARIDELVARFADTPWGEALRGIDRRRLRVLGFPDNERLLGIECRRRREADYFISIHTAIEALSRGKPGSPVLERLG